MTHEPIRRQERWQQRESAERELFYRNLNTLLHFWTTCANRQCRRERACCGARIACFDRNWDPMPEADKVCLRAALTALCEGRPPAEAARIGMEEHARFAALDAQIPAHFRESGNPEFIAGSALARGRAE
jgi:hypothetical protein